MKEMLPKYYIIKEELRKRIDSGELSSGSMVPSETELMNTFSVSRITARRAIEELVIDGYLYKIQGKGSFVKEREKKQWLSTIQSYTEEIQGLGMNPTRKVISNKVVIPVENIKSDLQLSDGENVFHLERVYYADDCPICYTETYVPLAPFPQIDQINFEKESLYQLMEKEYKIEIKRSLLTIKAVGAKERVAQYLGVDLGHPVLLSSAITYGVIGEQEFPIERFTTYYLTDEFSYNLEQFR